MRRLSDHVLRVEAAPSLNVQHGTRPEPGVAHTGQGAGLLLAVLVAQFRLRHAFGLRLILDPLVDVEHAPGRRRDVRLVLRLYRLGIRRFRVHIARKNVQVWHCGEYGECGECGHKKFSKRRKKARHGAGRHWLSDQYSTIEE